VGVADDSGRIVLSQAQLAATADVTEADVERLVEAGVLIRRESPEGPFRSADVVKVRMARACEEGGVPLDAISEAIRDGRLSFETLRSILTTFGFPPPQPGDTVVEAQRPRDTRA
jgi:hypothetical protein